jgi:hypothetical protein
MKEGRDCVNDVCTAIRDGLRQIGDFSYAIMPKDVAHAVGDLKKAFLTQVREALDCEIGWIDERVAGGDKMREEWREKCRQQTASDATSEV